MRRLKIGGLLIIMLFMVSACSNGNSSSELDPSNPVSISLWHYYVGDNKIALELAVDEFNQTIGMDQGVVVNAVAKGSIMDLENAITDSAKGVVNAEVMPELFSSYPDKAMEIDALGKICELNEYFSEEDQEKYVKEFLDEGVFEGERLLSIPIVKSTELLYVNQTAYDDFIKETDFDQSKLSTWEGVYETARAFYQWSDNKTPEIPWDGQSFMGVDSLANYVVIGNRQLGVEVIDGENKQAVLNRSAMRKVFDEYFGGMSLGYFNIGGKFRSDDIKTGDLVAYAGSTSGAAYFPTWIEKNNTQSDIDFLALSYPVFDGGEDYAIQQGAGMCVASSTPQKQEAAALFLKWFTEPQQNVSFAMTTGYLPVEKKAYESTDFSQTIDKMKSGDQAEKNVAAVYEIALDQIMTSKTYASAPFVGSYQVRTLLEDSLKEITETGKEKASELKSQGMSEEGILKSLDLDQNFETWLTNIKNELDAQGIAYIEE